MELVTRLRGMVDDQTLLGQLWFIRDPAEAARNLERQRREEAGTAGDACSKDTDTGRAETNGPARKEEIR